MNKYVNTLMLWCFCFAGVAFAADQVIVDQVPAIIKADTKNITENDIYDLSDDVKENTSINEDIINIDNTENNNTSINEEQINLDQTLINEKAKANSEADLDDNASEANVLFEIGMTYDVDEVLRNNDPNNTESNRDTCSDTGSAYGYDNSYPTYYLNASDCSSLLDGATINSAVLSINSPGSYCPSWYTQNVLMDATGDGTWDYQLSATGGGCGGSWDVASVLTATSIFVVQVLDTDGYSDYISSSSNYGSLDVDYSVSGVGGCMDSTACNYDDQATYDNSSCYYPIDDNHDCASSDGAGDGACGGVNNAVEDDCGVCGGDGFSCGSSNIANGPAPAGATSGDLYDQGGPNGNYPTSTNDAYFIDVTTGLIDVNVTQVELESCCDKLFICQGDGSPTGYPWYGSGDCDQITAAGTWQSDGSSITVHFRSDSSVTDEGFALSWAQYIPSGCSDATACNDGSDLDCYYPVDDDHDCASSDGAGDGACGGVNNASEDECGTCDADSSNDCVQDCAGSWGGTAVEDDCGVCGGSGPQNGYSCSGGVQSCDLDEEITLTIEVGSSTGYLSSEVEWNVAGYEGGGSYQYLTTDADNDGLFDLTITYCLADGDQTASFGDTYGDGWYQTTATITDSNGAELLSTTGPAYGCESNCDSSWDNCSNPDDSSGATECFLNLTFTVGAVPGCTDSDACNYDPNATADNGSCTFAATGYDCSGACVGDADYGCGCTDFWANNTSDVTVYSDNSLCDYTGRIEMNWNYTSGNYGYENRHYICDPGGTNCIGYSGTQASYTSYDLTIHLVEGQAYEVWSADTYGDGWSGGTWSVTLTDGTQIAGADASVTSGYNGTYTVDALSYCSSQYDCNGVCGGDAVADNCGTCDNISDNDCTQDCSGAWGGTAVVDDCGQCGGLNANVDCNNDCSGDFSSGTWVNGNPGSQDPTLPPYINGAADDGSWSLSDCGYTPGSGVNTDNGDGTVSIVAEYSTGGCVFSSSIFNGVVSVTTSSTHLQSDMSLTAPPSFTLDGGAGFSFSSTGTYVGFTDDGSLTGDLPGGSVGGAVADLCGTCDTDADNDCEADCNGYLPGEDDYTGAEIDDCDVCGGNNADKDCLGVCFGSAVPGCDDVCDSGLVDGCDGICDSGAVIGCDDVCDSGLVDDCFGDCDGEGFYLDDGVTCVLPAYDVITDLVATPRDDATYGPVIDLTWSKVTLDDADADGFTDAAYGVYVWDEDYYPDCTGIQSYIGNGYCTSVNNNPECGYDGGDCCASTNVDAGDEGSDNYNCYYGYSGYGDNYNCDCQDPSACESLAMDDPDYCGPPFVCGDGVCSSDVGEVGGDGGCYEDCGCLAGEFECATGGWAGNCIPGTWECDGGSPDCDNGADEANCGSDDDGTACSDECCAHSDCEDDEYCDTSGSCYDNTGYYDCDYFGDAIDGQCPGDDATSCTDECCAHSDCDDDEYCDTSGSCYGDTGYYDCCYFDDAIDGSCPDGCFSSVSGDDSAYELSPRLAEKYNEEQLYRMIYGSDKTLTSLEIKEMIAEMMLVNNTQYLQSESAIDESIVDQEISNGQGQFGGTRAGWRMIGTGYYYHYSEGSSPSDAFTLINYQYGQDVGPYVVTSYRLIDSSQESAHSNEASATTSILDAPTDLTAVLGDGGINLAWSYSGYAAPEYPGCTGNLSWISDGYCDSSNNVEECGYDGGDCCNDTCVEGTTYNCDGDGAQNDADGDGCWDTCYDPASSCTQDVPTCNGDYEFSAIALFECYGYSNAIEIAWNPGCSGVVHLDGEAWFSTSSYNPPVTGTGFDPGSEHVLEFVLSDGTVASTASVTLIDDNCDAAVENCMGNINYIGNGVCTSANNNADCEWDGGDCCASTNVDSSGIDGDDGNNCAYGDPYYGEDFYCDCVDPAACENIPYGDDGSCAPEPPSGDLCFDDPGFVFDVDGDGYIDTENVCDYYMYYDWYFGYSCAQLTGWGYDCTDVTDCGGCDGGLASSGDESIAPTLLLDDRTVNESTALVVLDEIQIITDSDKKMEYQSSPEYRLAEGFKVYKADEATGLFDTTSPVATVYGTFYQVSGDADGCYSVSAFDTSPAYESALSASACVAPDNCPLTGDTNGDGNVNVTDIVYVVNIVLGGGTFEECSDVNGDGSINVGDIVSIVNLILGNARAEGATEAIINVGENLSVDGNGFIQGAQFTLTHSSPITVELADEYVAYYQTDDMTTTLVVATDGSHSLTDIATISGAYEIAEAIVVNANDQVTTQQVLEVTSFGLSAAYPNPFNPVTSMQLVVPQDGFVSVKVYNLVGQEVATLAEGMMQGSSTAYTLRWDASAMASGVYLVKAQGAGQVSTQKLMLLK